MPISNIEIPYGAYWSSPFAKWQGTFANSHSLKLAAQVATDAFEKRGIKREAIDGVSLGMTVPQQSSFYGAPWLAGLIGLEGLSGPTINQACATSARVIQSAAADILAGANLCVLTVTADRCSNGPHVTYPNPAGPGGKPDAEDWVWDNFSKDPFAKNAMLDTAENVAREAGISKTEQDDVALVRFAQYQDALKDDRAFQKRYMLPVEVRAGKKVLGTVETDEGVFPMNEDKLRGLKPVMPEGTVSFGTQTFPADGNAGLVVTTSERARELSRDPKITVKITGFGSARVKKGFMAMAVVPAALQAAKQAGVELKDCEIKTHNPFAVNDAYFAKQTGIAIDTFNRYGSSLIFGHPQGPTGMRLIIELIEQLAMNGGGNGLFAGCAAGDSAMAVALRVDVA